MPSKFRFALIPIVLLAGFASASAADKMDLILEELKALRQQVDRLEGRIDELESEPTAQTSMSAVAVEPVKQKEKRKWFDSMHVEMKKAEARASGAWTNASSWTHIANGMKEDDVIAILGEPTDRKFSVRKDTDEILVYQGDLTGSGDPVYGEIRIYKGKIRRFSAPDLPEE